MRYIPRKTKVKITLFRNFTVPDLVLIFVGVLLAVLVAMSNISIANLPSYTKSHTATSECSSESTMNPIEQTRNSNWSNDAASYDLNTGFVWNINENLSLDTVLNIGVKPSLQGILNDTMTIGVTYKM